MKYSKFFLLLCVACSFLSPTASSLLKADLIYTIEGIANDFPDPNNSPAVGVGEAFVAEFLIDSSTADVDPAADQGEYAGAILSSSITFSGGYTSTVDFAGGNLVILQNNGGFGGVNLSDLAGNGTLLFAGTDPFASDSILDATTPVLDGPLTLFSLTEPTGLVTSLSLTATPTLTITAIPEPSTFGLVAIGFCGLFVRRRR